MTTRVNERDPPQITTSLRGGQSPTWQSRSPLNIPENRRDCHGPVGPRNDVVIFGWSFYFGMVVIAAERAIPESPLRWGQ